MPVLGLAGCHWRKTGKLQVRFHRNNAASSLAADCNVPQRPPAELENPVHDWKNESVETKQPNHRLEVLHLFRWSTHTLLHTDAFTHRRYYTQTLLHTNAFTHRRFYAQALLHTDTFTHKRIYTNKCRIMLGNPLRDLARRSVITYNHTFSLHFYYQNVVLCLGTRFGSGRSIITHFHQISTSMSY